MFNFGHCAGSSSRDRRVREIAERSVAQVELRLRNDTATMSVAELRGYVRARAASVVNAQARRSIAQRRLPSAQVDELIAAALERTVHLVVSDLFVQPPVVAIPTPHVRLRVAA